MVISAADKMEEQIASLGDIDEKKIREFLNVAEKDRGLDIKEDVSVKEALMRLKLLQTER